MLQKTFGLVYCEALCLIPCPSGRFIALEDTPLLSAG